MLLKIDDLWIGHIDSSNVTDLEYLAANVPSLFEMFNYVLISHLDSHDTLHVSMPSINKILAKKPSLLREYDNNLLSNGKTILEIALHENIFNGFDEIWFFHAMPPSGVPKNLVIFSEIWAENQSNKTEDINLQLLIRWMSTSKAVLGLADGQGLNYVTSNETIAKLLEDTYRQ